MFQMQKKASYDKDNRNIYSDCSGDNICFRFFTASHRRK
ncbi:Hypothetical protein CFV354_1617 [Campylobacter fetus subsp. venerealis NCTC 10354]|nr:Hypothetical protein CFV354_1617 [Campylobacter fetus subsp. venerealis NCTC 10354]